MSQVKRLQESLDSQAQALEQRSPKIKQARAEIDECLREMELASSTESARLHAQLETLCQRRAAHNARAAEVAAKLSEADSQLAAIDAAPDAQQLLIDQQELEEVDKQLEILSARRRELANACAGGAAAIEAKRTKWRKIKALKPLEAFDPTGIHQLTSEHSQVEKELVATAEGRALWGQTCNALNELDAQLGAHDLQEALQALTQTANLIHHNLEYARTKSWRPLETAIAHEHKVLLEAVEAVNNAINE